MKTTAITTIIFDLGGVLIKLRDSGDFTAYLASHGTRMDLLTAEITGLMDSLGTGKLSFPELYKKMVSKYGMKDSLRNFESAFNTLQLDSEIPGMYGTLRELKKHYKVVLLSNTNLVHIKYTKKSTRILRPLDRLFLSYEMGYLKPDPRIFKALLEDMSVAPEETLFIDDVEENIRAAGKLGMNVIKAGHNRFSGALIRERLLTEKR